MLTWLKRCCLFLCLFLAPLLIFFAMLLLTRGKFSGVLAIALTAAIAVALCWWLYRRRPSRQRAAFVALVALIPAALCAFLCLPMAPTTPPDEQVFASAPTQFWELSTGKRLAYYHLPAATNAPPKATILFLHGGPGSSVSAAHVSFFQRFTQEGFEVYLYDQAGTGRSDLLPPAEYSHERNVSDLAEVVARIDAASPTPSNIALVGQSYGGTLAASAVADDRIAPHLTKVVFSEPGVIPQKYSEFAQYVDEHIPNSDPQNPRKPVEEIPLALLKPRLLVGLLMLPRDSEFLPQEEALNVLNPQEILDLNRYSYCTDEPIPPNEADAVTGIRVNPYVNAYVNSSPNSDTNPFDMEAFQHSKVPGMLLLGECSYVYRRDQLAFITAYSSMERVQYAENFGHNVLRTFDDGRDAPFQSILAFLNDEPAPLPNYPSKNDLKEFVEHAK